MFLFGWRCVIWWSGVFGEGGGEVVCILMWFGWSWCCVFVGVFGNVERGVWCGVVGLLFGVVFLWILCRVVEGLMVVGWWRGVGGCDLGGLLSGFG